MAYKIITGATVGALAADTDGICQAQAPGGAGNLTINGALTSGGVFSGTYGRLITVNSVGDSSARTLTFTGTDVDDKTLVFSIAAPNATTITLPISVCFKTITQIAINGASTGNLIVGVDVGGMTSSYPTDGISDNPINISGGLPTEFGSVDAFVSSVPISDLSSLTSVGVMPFVRLFTTSQANGTWQNTYGVHAVRCYFDGATGWVSVSQAVD